MEPGKAGHTGQHLQAQVAVEVPLDVIDDAVDARNLLSTLHVLAIVVTHQNSGVNPP